jgi:hypothetical protein
MRAEHEAMNVVRAELCDRLQSLQDYSARHSARDFSESVVGIRRLAAAYGLTPVVRLTEALERAMGEGQGGRACATSLYLDRLQDAIGCQRLDDAASEAMIASISVRLA